MKKQRSTSIHNGDEDGHGMYGCRAIFRAGRFPRAAFPDLEADDALHLQSRLPEWLLARLGVELALKPEHHRRCIMSVRSDPRAGLVGFRRRGVAQTPACE